MDDHAKLLLSRKAHEQLRQDFTDPGLIDGIQLFRAVRFLAQRMNEAQTLCLSEHGVSATKFNYLAVLYVNRETGLTAGELGASVRTSSGSVTTMIDSLVRERLAGRREHPTDGRSVVIKLTARGERLYLDCAKTHHDNVLGTKDRLGGAKVTALVALLVEAGNALQAAAPESAPAIGSLGNGRSRS